MSSKRYRDSSPDDLSLRQDEEEPSASYAIPAFEEDLGDIWKTFVKADEIGQIG